MIKSILILLISVLLCSCSNELKESMEKTEDCLENKYDDGEGASKYASIDEALTAYDFQSARNLLSCYENACFLNNTRQSWCPEFRTLGKSDETRKQWANRKGYNNAHFKYLYQIVNSEVAYFLNINEILLAKNSALEADMFFIYRAALPNAINNLIDNDKIIDAVSMLMKYTFKYAFESRLLSSANKNYNDEINTYNDMLNPILLTAIFDNDQATLKKILIMYKPVALKDVNNWILINKSRKEAIMKINEAGITL